MESVENGWAKKKEIFSNEKDDDDGGEERKSLPAERTFASEFRPLWLYRFDVGVMTKVSFRCNKVSF